VLLGACSKKSETTEAEWVSRPMSTVRGEVSHDRKDRLSYTIDLPTGPGDHRSDRDGSVRYA
jgi:hypothetical protein